MGSLLLAFLAGGWVFGRLMSNRPIAKEVESLYSSDGASMGIFDVPPSNMMAEQGEMEEPQEVDFSEIAAIIPAAEVNRFPFEEKPSETAPIELRGDEVVSIATKEISPEDGMEDTQRTMLTAPVRYFVIQSTDEYKKFKQKARGSYPSLDFSKQMLVVLESDSNLPDNIFETVSAEEKENTVMVNYRVNILELDKRINSHAVLPVKKTKAPIELHQVL